MMKKVIILYGKIDWRSKVPMTDEKYRFCYEQLIELAKKYDVEIFFSSYQWYNPESKKFKYNWTHDGKRWIKQMDIKPDLVYDKTGSKPRAQYKKDVISRNHLIINDPEFTLLAGNKFFVSLLFPNYFKRYFRVANEKELRTIASSISGGKIVIKPTIGSSGKDVKIVDKTEVEKIRVERPVIVQEFIDSSKGISGIVKGMHDLRLVFINDELVYSYVRQPAEGSYLANLAQGGSMFIVEPEQIPKKVFDLTERIGEVFSAYEPRVFTVDLMFDEKQNPWIIELNTMPGMYFSPDQKKWMKKMYTKLIKVFINVIKDGKKIR